MSPLLSILPPQASSLAPQVDLLYGYLVAVSLFFASVIFLLVVIFAIKYRRRREDERPAELHGNVWLEIIWSAIPLLITFSFFGWGTLMFFQHIRPPANSHEIFVVGKQWMWKIQHPEGPREINELHIPVGRPIKLTITSEDVIHSFYVPAFRTKMDAVPGRYTTTWFKPTQTGEFHLFCAEYCGTEHSRMIGTVFVMSEDDYENWLSERSGETPTVQGSGDPLIARGTRLFAANQCLTCHQGTSYALGPSLTGLYGTEVKLDTGKTVIVDDNYLRESILQPNRKLVAGYQAVMPTFQNVLSEEDVLALIAYIKSLGGDAPNQE